MKEKHIKRWAKTREKGKWVYVIKYTLIHTLWMTIFMQLFAYFFSDTDYFTLFVIGLMLILFSISGVLGAVLNWNDIEKKYKKAMEKNKE